MRTRWVGSVIAALVATGCIVEAPGGGKAQQDKARAAGASSSPLVLRNGANLGGKVELAAVTVVPGRFLPGEAVRVQVLFKVLAPIEEDYTIFVHVEDADGRAERMNVDHPPANGTRPTSSWKPGETIADEFTVGLPAGRPLRGINLFLGLWEPNSDTRMPLTNPDQVKHDGNNRILIAQVPAAL